MSEPSPTPSFRERAAAVMMALQDEICGGLIALERDAGGDGAVREDAWERPGGGGGRSRVFADGVVLEKAGVNVSVVHGELSEAFARQLPGDGRQFFATGTSLVLHPQNPHAPTVHANFRYLEHGERRWFGGGADLTPSYLYDDDSAHFHATWQAFCAAHPDLDDWPRWRDECDRYFYLPHRGERRGVGGIFFDDLTVDGDPAKAERLLAAVQAAGAAFLAAYLPIVTRRKDTAFTADERAWQELRRGRYVEFNLVYDRGTVFGLKTDGRVESILMSMPPRARWAYMAEPPEGTPEARLLAALREPPPAAAAGDRGGR
jgi:coproporphyrinogen III oxidase